MSCLHRKDTVIHIRVLGEPGNEANFRMVSCNKL